ncbi:PAS/PAC sensor-containing diguanylate cyclase/phosphodiesterase [Catenovulum agarivorans DS-2]|uniref:PAS/PAC sensor-containing diguanylate cyclase/phosphodiesterase n=1 Tax=Catenovulum agarivorans DS-2 TaxID=1328313 RepID=W7QAF2_9ALTE|nr:EAL domain-containing protein [Catenovulum agarivorans]EWH08991.1 PAS/PAC sensor-containing diguanylate cyclase/phosphodiesterase [Catenovulum agarivorans DS-2]
MVDLELGILNRSAFFTELKTEYQNGVKNNQQALFIALEYDCVCKLRSVICTEHISFLLANLVEVFKAHLPERAILGRSLKEINAYIPNVELSDLNQIIQRLQNAFEMPIYLPNGRMVEVKPKLLSAFLPGILQTPNDPDAVINQLAMFLGHVDQMDQVKTHFHLNEQTLSYLNQRIQIDKLILGAQANDELYVLYQPKVTMGNQGIIGAEALIRWSSPQLGLVSPEQFIQRAEFTGMIQALSLYVLQDAIVLLDRARVHNEQFTVSINLTATCIESGYFIAELEHCVKHSGHPASAFEFEVTETVAIQHYETAIKGLERIHALGCKIALDDFGTGYSSLSWLSKLPLDTLKIDRTFVSNMFNSNADVQIIKAVIALAKACELNVIAEGIETEEQAEVLESLGCEQGQGFYFERPIHPVKLLPLIQAQSHQNAKYKAKAQRASRRLWPNILNKMN